MTTVAAEWSATVEVHAPDARLLDWIERALGPEAAREVPRSTAELDRGRDGGVVLSISARDSGAMRAALNTYLGWIHLSIGAAAAARLGRAARP
ncbi:MAG TPA: KEOPS complex subunit Pcc1 [Thermoplasmata archaeon]|nr:KEOPS complex subunit Pcc1 [Thermoplasmata archaeon]